MTWDEIMKGTMGDQQRAAALEAEAAKGMFHCAVEMMDVPSKLRATATQFERLQSCGKVYALSETRQLLMIVVRDIDAELAQERAPDARFIDECLEVKS